ncbi:hypothetical protein K443DRAFT_130575 [Laccaria amethystina LaAM-08-1]|uniref:Isopropylmalate dehydrogenase-like domain-containing protein n=1 Tax=Laccaria amethystina LaAM-08-1 TaxID=1095629 RepID=A0A0C9Y4B1_9AGAR|nr:hypothetical protein K443DRAFT_130575 [Laccaria amethystina LaAM-08-1]
MSVLPGDGIGLEAAEKRFGFQLEFRHYIWASCTCFQEHGTMLPPDWKKLLQACDAIYFGAGMMATLLLFRREFDQYINLRPCCLFPGVTSPLANREGEPIDFITVRENTEGEYSSVGGCIFEGTDGETVIQDTVFTRTDVDRVLRYAFELARSITVEKYHIDILCAHFVQRPRTFDVVVGSNLLGDILSNLGPPCTGTIGIAPSASLNPSSSQGDPDQDAKPVHGSAPDIAGQGITNPVGKVWSGQMMLEWLGEKEATQALMGAIEKVLQEGTNAQLKGESDLLTPDMGGKGTTEALGRAIEEEALEIKFEEGVGKKIITANIEPTESPSHSLPSMQIFQSRIIIKRDITEKAKASHGYTK